MSTSASYLLPQVGPIGPVEPATPAPAGTYDETLLGRLRDAAGALLPPGRAFSRRLSSQLMRVVEALVVEAARVQNEALALRASISPLRARRDDYLEAWQEAAGTDGAGTPSERAARAASAIHGLVGRTRADFEAVAAAYGFSITWPVEVQLPFRAGVSTAQMPANGDAWAYTLTLRVSGTGDTAALLVALSKLRRAHTLLRIAVIGDTPPPPPVVDTATYVASSAGDLIVDSSGNQVVP